jgi:hypothetical protein
MSQKPADALARFMFGIFDFYRDKGMPHKTAKARMYDETLDTLFKMMREDPDIPDHGLVIALQFVSRLLNNRGVQLSNELRKSSNQNDLNHISELRKALSQLKTLKTQVDEFISAYKGVDSHGKN